MHIKRSRLTAIMSIILSLLSLYASLLGVFDKSLYQDVFLAGTIPENLIAGSIAQDIISIPAALILLVLSVRFLKQPGIKTLVGILGLAWYFFYAFGLYTIQGQYTSIYLVYLAIFGLSIYTMIFGLTSLKPDEFEHSRLPKALRIGTGVFLLMILFVLGSVWIAKILPDIARHTPPATYGVFVLDLGVVFPAFGVVAALLLMKKPFGHILAGVALIKGVTICLSWGFGEWFGPFYGGYAVNYGMLAIAGTLTVISSVLMTGYLIKFEVIEE